MGTSILAIATSIKTGSLALLHEADVIDSWTGNDAVSRSEDLVPQIDLLLTKNRIELDQIQHVAVSTGPGSFTGIRVGMAVAKGLALALRCGVIGVSILEAFASTKFNSASDNVSNLICVVPGGRDQYFWQVFNPIGDKTNLLEVRTGNAELLENELCNYNSAEVLTESIAYHNLVKNNFKFLTNTRKITGNYAQLIGRCIIGKNKNNIAEDNVPLYVRPAIAIKK